MKFEKVAIVKNGVDIGRIIPFNFDVKDEVYDFKISFVKNKYNVLAYQLLSEEPEEIDITDMEKWEISYHRSAKLNPPVIHLKRMSDRPIYQPLPLKRLKDPSIHNEFPVPFMKLEIPTNIQGKQYKAKPKEHVLLDTEENNVAEFYLMNKKFGFDQFEEKWPTLNMNVMVSPFEYFATNELSIKDPKFQNFMPKISEPRNAVQGFIVNDNMILYVNVYNNAEYLNDNIQVTFIDNEFSDALLGLSQFRYEDTGGKFKVEPFYKRDLEISSMSKDEKAKWEYRFSKMRVKLDREIKKKNSRS